MLLVSDSDVMSRITYFQITILLSLQHSREPRSAEEKRRDSNWQDEQNSVGKRALAFPIKGAAPRSDTAGGLREQEAALRLTTYTGPEAKARP